MTGSTRFELASSSPEGSTFAPAYPNGQRGSYGGASLDRSGSFRESAENRARTSGSGTSRGSTMMVEVPPLSQSLTLEQFSLGDQKFTCLGELRRIMSVSPRITSGDHLTVTSLPKALTPVLSEELKRLKATVQDTSVKARDRAKMFNECIVKLDKYRQTLLSRKRQRNEVSSTERLSGMSLSKAGSQVHQNSSDLATQRLEDRTKNAVPNKRVRTSVAEVRSEGRGSAFSRQGVAVEKDRDMLRAGNAGSVQVEDKIRGLPAGGDGWEKKMRRKRSMAAVGTRTIDNDVELKQRMQPRLNNESLSRPSDGDRELKRFRSGYSNGMVGISKSDGSSINSSSVRTTPRNDLDNVTLPNRTAGLDKDRVITKGNNKLNLREDNQAGSPGAVTKGKASRAPRTGSGVLVSPSSNFSRTAGALDGWEQSSCSNKFQSASGVNNRKRPVPTESSLPSVPQWANQRAPKNSRSKRTNMVSPVSNHDEPHISPEGFPASDIGARSTSSEANGPMLTKGASGDSQQFKMKVENVSSPAGLLSESEESGACDNKSKVKGLDVGEIEDGAVNGIQKATAFVLPKKNKIPIKDEIGDCVRRQGRTARGSALSRPGTPLTGEKMENTATAKPMRSTKPGPDKSESKSGRPPNKKSSDRKVFTRPGKVVNTGSLEFTGESDDDREELLASATSARNANHLTSGCSGSFWKKMESIFSCASLVDIAYLKQQISFAEELDGNFFELFSGDESHTVESTRKPLPSSQSLAFGERKGGRPNGLGLSLGARCGSSMNGSRDFDTLNGNLETERWFEKIIPLSQRLLQAFIVEDENEEFYPSSERRDAFFQYSSDDSPCGPCNHINNEANGGMTESKVDSEVDLKTKHRNMDKISCNGSAASNNYMGHTVCDLLYNDEVWEEEEALVHSEIGQNNLQPMQTNSSSISSIECQYQEMSLDDRILAELHSIGLFPDTVPDLTEGEDEDINKNISELQLGLFQQAKTKKGQLCELEKTVRDRREMEERDREKLAMSNLVEMAYKKHTGCRSGNKGGVNKVSKQVALAFVSRTLARCYKFEETGRSCFSEPALRDLIFSPPLDISDSKFADWNSVGTDVNLHIIDNQNYQPELRTSGAAVALSSAERHVPINDKLDRCFSDVIQDPFNISDPTFTKIEQMPNRVKKKEVLLDNVGMSVSRAASALVNTLSGGAKGKRSERERDQGKDASTRSSLAKSGRPSVGNLKGERKTKTKPKQKTAQLSTTGNGLLGRSSETTNAASPMLRDPSETVMNSSGKANGEMRPQDPSIEMEEPLDFSKLQLPGIDMIEELAAPDLGGQGQDFGSWFNFDVDNLQDNDLIGLSIPMDDLSTI